MRRTSWADVIEKLSTPVFLPIFFVYLFSMVAYPFYDLGGDWDKVQKVWDRWQTFNAATIAFGASVIALMASKHKEDREQARNYMAAEAFLTNAFRELVFHLQSNFNILRKAHESSIPINLKGAPPAITEYKEVFKECIRFAPPNYSTYLVQILREIQSHESAMSEVRLNWRFHTRTTYMLFDAVVILAKMYRRPYITKFSADVEIKAVTFMDFKNALGALGVETRFPGRLANTLLEMAALRFPEPKEQISKLERIRKLRSHLAKKLPPKIKIAIRKFIPRIFLDW